MSVLRFLFANALALLVAGCLQGCKEDAPKPADPVAPPTTTDPTPTQYGTPFGGVPDRQDAVMYQVNMRAFSQGSNFAGVTARIDSIKDLGVNVLYLMPIYPIGQLRGVNSPYAVQDYRAVNPEFGTLADLRQLVDAAHARGLTVMLDWVANHTAWDHPWITAHSDWYQKDAAGNIISPSNNGVTYNDVAQLNFANAAMRLQMIAAMKYWVYTANIDGFRFDYADFQPNDFWKQANDTLRTIKTHKLLLLAEGTRASNFASGFDYNFGFSFYGGFWDVYRRAMPATRFDAINATEYTGATAGQHVVRYITNHDVNGSDGTPVTLFGGKAGAMSAFVIAALYRGIPMVYNGQEAGMTRNIPFPFTSVKITWGANPDVTRAYKQLLAARSGSAALRRGTPTSYSSANVCAFTKTSGTDQALVLVNVRNAPSTYTLPAAQAGTTWTDALQNTPVTLGQQVTLPAYGYLVLKK
ncbi:alpha-glucosidase C-terminal domain-containing protein [Hymenobacter sp. BT175]|uniref:alpha-amylase family glycosyl hydrolase n=1 Tax=Hymenobacter translucens TaxID=2886507 RepID=UPI001D0DED9E|nr:alpha-amylase family glycosyl hydrolase [Hymenobacter translucens]MCC2545362.1 alpha-glucosidase C-terminal domain-containing protein [Hymenobacter translucens]